MIKCRLLFLHCSAPNHLRVHNVKEIKSTPKAALLFWFFGDFRCGALLFMVIHVIYKYKNK